MNSSRFLACLLVEYLTMGPKDGNKWKEAGEKLISMGLCHPHLHSPLPQLCLPSTRKDRTHCRTEMTWSCFSTLDLLSQETEKMSWRAERMLEPVPAEEEYVGL